MTQSYVLLSSYAFGQEAGRRMLFDVIWGGGGGASPL